MAYTLGIYTIWCVLHATKLHHVCWPLKRNRKAKEKNEKHKIHTDGKITPPPRDIHADLTLLAQVVKPE